jgi:hypothetical protein
MVQECSGPSGEFPFYQTPTFGKIIIPFRESPDAVKMVRQEDPGVDSEWMLTADLSYDLPQNKSALRVC